MIKKDLLITSKDDYLDKFTLKTSELKLLASADGVEIMNHSIDKDVMFTVSPASKENIIEFFYVLNGTVECSAADNDEVRIIKAGDSFLSQNLAQNYIFKTITDCQFLYVSTLPVFHMMGDQMKEMNILNRELEAKDSYTKGHSERVHHYSMDIAHEMGLNRDVILGIALAALFHDVGKIDIPTDILKKDSALTEEEYKTVMDHPKKSSNLIKNVKYKDVSHIVEQHHERIDGTGYPNGLKGDQICVEAKIISVADAYDAMSSDRPYRKALSEDLVVEEINNYKGIWYDEEVVEAFNRYIVKKNKTKG